MMQGFIYILNIHDETGQSHPPISVHTSKMCKMQCRNAFIHVNKGHVHFEWGKQVVLNFWWSAFGHRLSPTHHRLGLQTMKYDVGLHHKLSISLAPAIY